MMMSRSCGATIRVNSNHCRRSKPERRVVDDPLIIWCAVSSPCASTGVAAQGYQESQDQTLTTTFLLGLKLSKMHQKLVSA